MRMIDRGPCHERFATVAKVFAEALDEELGAGFSVVVDGEVAVDLAGGFADRARTQPFTRATLTPVYSTTKALAAIMVARLVDLGKLAYEQPVASVWPEFGQHGKDRVTIAQALSHQSGVPGFKDAIPLEEWFDWDAICARIAAAEPLWPPGTRSGYHATLYGFIAGEIFRRVEGRTIGTALREDVAEPHGWDLWIGLPEEEDFRVADLERPKTLPDFGEMNESRRLAFMTRWAAPPRTGPEWRRAEFPSANGHCTASSLALLMGQLACGGGDILSAETLAQASKEWIAGDDLVMPYRMSWGAGLMRNTEGMYGPNPDSFGHSGWGGSCAFADPERGIAMAYVMNRQSALLLGDPRPRRLIEAAYTCL
jgi:CubicO group peptidase (beta-lactamase class C family)